MNPDEALDQQALTRLRSWGGDQFVKKMCELFLSECGPKVGVIRKRFEAQDWLGVEKIAHSVKSSAANIGALSVRSLTEQIERLAKDHDQSAIAPLLGELERAYSQVQRDLENLISEK